MGAYVGAVGACVGAAVGEAVGAAVMTRQMRSVTCDGGWYSHSMLSAQTVSALQLRSVFNVAARDWYSSV